MLTLTKNSFLERFEHQVPKDCETVKVTYWNNEFLVKCYSKAEEFITSFEIINTKRLWFNFSLKEKALYLLQKGECFHCNGNEYSFLETIDNFMLFYCTFDSLGYERPHVLVIGIDEEEAACELLLNNPWGLRLCYKTDN